MMHLTTSLRPIKTLLKTPVLSRLAWALVWSCTTLVVGCDRQRISQLEEGVATEADVRAQLGTPDAIYDESSGARVFEYTRQPEGHRNYMITIGPDGKMTALRQVLQAANFATINGDWDQTQVRRRLGRPAKVQRFDLTPDEEIWSWRFMEGTQSQWFSVTFDRSGHVLHTAVTLDDKPGN